MSLESAIELARAGLPANMMLSINIERDGVALDLFDINEGTPIDLADAGISPLLPIEEQVNQAVELAIGW